MTIRLNDVEARVLGSLMEKDATTPEYYPLSLNALVNACNQRSNRDPVMDLDEDAVRQALGGLSEERLAGPASGADRRVTKYEHRVQEVLNLTRAENALLCVLLLRGAQTPGELRARTERMYRFGELDEVHSVLQRMMQREEPIVTMLPRRPGTKEIRYTHLLSGPVSEVTPSLRAEAPSGPGDSDRISRLEEEVQELRQEIAELRRQLQHHSSRQ